MWCPTLPWLIPRRSETSLALAGASPSTPKIRVLVSSAIAFKRCCESRSRTTSVCNGIPLRYGNPLRSATYSESDLALIGDIPEVVPVLATVAASLPVPLQGFRCDASENHSLDHGFALPLFRLSPEFHGVVCVAAPERQVATLVVDPGLLPHARTLVVDGEASTLKASVGGGEAFLDPTPVEQREDRVGSGSDVAFLAARLFGRPRQVPLTQPEIELPKLGAGTWI